MKIYSAAKLPKGFLANGVVAGIKASNKRDLGLLVSPSACTAAAVFTSNKLAAACVAVSKHNLKISDVFHGVIVNSGNANCFTGEKGVDDAHVMTHAAAFALGFKPKQMFVCSTGIIGKKLPIKNIVSAVPELTKGLSAKKAKEFSQAILTTDKFKKEAMVVAHIGGKPVTISIFAKGAGMICPNMATMLCFIVTDAAISASALRKALADSVDGSFNSISVDGCQSTNDTVIALANGCAGNAVIPAQGKGYESFVKALKQACLSVAKLIVKDGEGASKIIQIDVEGAATKKEAKRVGMTVANSSLFKTAMYGGDPNFGRIVQAVGVSGIDIKEKDLRITFSDLKKKEVVIGVHLKRGSSRATVYTSDLTPEYIRVNSHYN